MNEWWIALSGLQRFFYFIAIPSTLILFIQFFLSMLGLDSNSDTDLDMDLDGTGVSDFNMNDDLDATVSGDFQFVSFRGIIAFLTIFGWVGQVLTDSNLHIAIIILIATMSGFLAMLLVASLFYLISKLQSSGNINYKNAIGSLAEVYIPIPKNHQGMGKVQLTIQERYMEVDAITQSNTNFKTGDIVRVIDIFNGTVLIVDQDN